MSYQNFKHALSQRFSLLSDKADDEEIERRLREGVDLVGATPWILMFAILVASIGLNVNSAAVIIGAMLISPLMGPIMGVGLGIAVYDFELVKRAFLNLVIATVISLLVSTLYFSISPLSEAQSELLARTSPNLWDVLVALFGGLAGVIGMTRLERSNVIPGVAIATALMPPVCTAGFGIASGNWSFVLGALYLYAINCVFIAIATIIGIRILGLKEHNLIDGHVQRRVKHSIFLVALCTALPSTYLATNLVTDEVFKSQARKFVAEQFAFESTYVAGTKIDPHSGKIEVSLIGMPIDEKTLKQIESKLAMAQLGKAKIVVHQASSNKFDITDLKSNLLTDLFQTTQAELLKKDEELKQLKELIKERNSLFEKAEDISNELRAQYPDIQKVVLSEGVIIPASANEKSLLQLTVHITRPLRNDEQERMQNWFRVRSKSETALVTFQVVAKIKE